MEEKNVRLLKREMEHKILGAIREFEIAIGLYIKEVTVYCADENMTAIDINTILV